MSTRVTAPLASELKRLATVPAVKSLILKSARSSMGSLTLCSMKTNADEEGDARAQEQDELVEREQGDGVEGYRGEDRREAAREGHVSEDVYLLALPYHGELLQLVVRPEVANIPMGMLT